MSIKTNIDLKRAFAGGGKAPAAQGEDEHRWRVRTDTPKPALRPRGSWRAMANAVDQKVREQEDARKAKNQWAARQQVKSGRRRGMGLKMAFRRAAEDE